MNWLEYVYKQVMTCCTNIKELKILDTKSVKYVLLTFTTLFADPADNKICDFSLYFPRK